MAEMVANTADIFNLRHQQDYALEIVARDDENKVVAVRCLFCVHLGREPAPDGALRQRSQNVRAWRTFHPINFQRHHEGQHAAHWKLYQACTPAEKDMFFEKYKKDDQVASSAGSVGAAAVASSTAGAAGAELAPVKRPRGRPRSNGAASIQWSDEMAQRLLQLRFETYAKWFSGESRASKHDGWKLITSTLTDEFGTTVDSEQCKNKLRLLKVHTQKQEPGASPSVGPDGSVTASQSRRAVAAPSAAVVSADDVSADAPVKRGRGRPRLNRAPNEQPSSSFVSQKKQRVLADNDASGDINTVLLKRILQATEEQKDALIAQKKAAEAQTASIQELLQFLKSRGEIPALGEKPIVPVVTSSELVWFYVALPRYGAHKLHQANLLEQRLRNNISRIFLMCNFTVGDLETHSDTSTVWISVICELTFVPFLAMTLWHVLADADRHSVSEPLDMLLFLKQNPHVRIQWTHFLDDLSNKSADLQIPMELFRKSAQASDKKPEAERPVGGESDCDVAAGDDDAATSGKQAAIADDTMNGQANSRVNWIELCFYLAVQLQAATGTNGSGGKFPVPLTKKQRELWKKKKIKLILDMFTSCYELAGRDGYGRGEDQDVAGGCCVYDGIREMMNGEIK